MRAFDNIVQIYDMIRAVNREPMEEPPTSRESVRSQLAKVGLQMPEVLEDLYSWHNGIYHLNAFLHILSVEEAVEYYQSYFELTRDYGGFGWCPGWLPVIDINGDTQYCLSENSKEIAAVDVECGTFSVVANDYERVLDAIAAAFKRGDAVFEKGGGCFEISAQKWKALAREFGIKPGGGV